MDNFPRGAAAKNNGRISLRIFYLSFLFYVILLANEIYNPLKGLKI